MPKYNSDLKPNTSFCISLTGILSAIAFLFCFLAGISPAGGISILAIASFFIGVIILETNVKYSVASWLVTGMLVVFFVSQKLMAIPAALFFLPYPIVKKLIEKEGFVFTSVDSFAKLMCKWLCKVVFFFVSFAISYYLLVKFFGVDYVVQMTNRLSEFNINLPSELMYIMITILCLIVFVIYDVLFSMLGRQYIFKYSRLLRRNKQ